MKVKNIAIEATAHLMLDNQLWADVKKLVTDIDNDKDLTSQEKHYIVLSDLKIIFSDVSTALLNFAITLAVIWARKQQAQS